MKPCNSLFLFGSLVVAFSTLAQPVITVPLTNQWVLLGTPVTLAIGVSGTGPFSYQWRLNGSNLPPALIVSAAGNGTTGFAGDGGPATAGEFQYPYGLAMDGSGDVYVADPYNQRIRKFTPDGRITTVAGTGVSGFSGDGGFATNAMLNSPWRVAVDSTGNLFIADSFNFRIRKVDSTGFITTVAGNGLPGYAGDNIAATNTSIAGDQVAIDRNGNLYIGGGSDCRIRRVDPEGIIHTVAGSGTFGFRGDGGFATNAQIGWCYGGIGLDKDGNLLIADTDNYRVRKVDANGIITTIAGGGLRNPADDIPATNATLTELRAVTSDAFGNILIIDGNRVRCVDANGLIHAAAGSGDAGNGGDGGSALNAEMRAPGALAADPLGGFFVSDSWNSRVRHVVPSNQHVLPLGRTTFANDGTYSVIVTDRFFDAISSANLVVADLPRFQSSWMDGNTLNFMWSTTPTLSYQVQYASDPASLNWTNLGAPITATNSTTTVQDAINPDAQRFYRVELLLP